MTLVELDSRVAVLSADTEGLPWVSFDTRIGIVDVAVKTAAIFLHIERVGIHPPLIVEGVVPPNCNFGAQTWTPVLTAVSPRSHHPAPRFH